MTFALLGLDFLVVGEGADVELSLLARQHIRVELFLLVISSSHIGQPPVFVSTSELVKTLDHRHKILFFCLATS